MSNSDVDSSIAESEAPPTSCIATAIVGLLLVISFILCFIIQSLVALLTCPLLCCRSGRELFYHVQSYILRSINALLGVALNPFWSVHVLEVEEGSDDSRETGMGSIFFSNHRSNADPFAVAWLQLAKCIEARYVYKGSLAKVPCIGCSLKLGGDLGAHFGDKEQISQMIEQAKDLLSTGHNIVVFPEGTRSPSGLLQDFKPKFFEICAELGCPAVAVCLLGTERAWPQGGMKVGCARITAVLSKPILPDETGSEGLRRKVRETMQECARHGLEAGEVDKYDPFFTGKPYSWWSVPEELQHLSEEERIQQLQSGKAHARGKNLF